MISYINQLRSVDGLEVKEAAYKGALDRMRPVLMTATVAVLGLIPAAMSNGIGAQSQKPFAIAIIGGLLSATALTLVVLPALYTLIHRDKRPADPQTPALATTLASLAVLALASMTLSGCNSPPQTQASALRAGNVNTAAEPNNITVDHGPNNAVVVQLTAAQIQDIGLQTAVAHRGSVEKTIVSPGRVGPNAEQSVSVSTPSAGRATEVDVRLGDYVKAGQVMTIIKSDAIGQIQSDLLQNMLQAAADTRQQEVQLKLSRITFDRESKLYSDQVSAKADMQAAENQLEKDTANLAALKAKMDATLRVAQERLSLLGAPPDSARKVVSQKKIDPYVIIRAPRAGLVIERTINPGELNDGTKQLFTLADLSEVWLFADIFEKDIELVKKGQEADVAIDSIPGKTFDAKIIWVGDAINPTTRTLPVRANVENKDFLLKPGMFARMKVLIGRVPATLVPRTSVIQKGDKELVFVQEGAGKFRQKEIKSGAEDSKNIEIISGLTTGERVVSQGGTELLGAAMKSSEAGD